MQDYTEKVALTEAQARVVIAGLDALAALIDGDIDGKRRQPWHHLAMDAEEGEDVPGALTHEAGFRALMAATRERMVRVTIP